MSTQSPPVVRSYLARVRTALADLPDAEVEEILEDVRPHLLEIAGELGEDDGIEAMSERIGTPESYAAELRSAGDYPAPPASGSVPSAGRAAPRLALWSLLTVAVVLAFTGLAVGVSLQEEGLVVLLLVAPVIGASAWYVWHRGTDWIGELPEVRRTRTLLAGDDPKRTGGARAYLRSLRPAWWLLCAVVLVVLALLLAVRSGSEGFLVLPVLFALAAGALWAGPRSRVDRRLLWLTMPVSALAAGSALGGLGFLVGNVESSSYTHDGPYAATQNMALGEPTLYYGQNEVMNVYAFDENGEPITDFYLYDQNGDRLATPRYRCDERVGAPTAVGRDNRYPRPHLEQRPSDTYMSCVEETKGVPFSVTIPRSEASESANPMSTTPGPTGSATSTPKESTPKKSDSETGAPKPTG